MSSNALEDLRIRRKISAACIRRIKFDKVLEPLQREAKLDVLEQAFADIREVIHALRTEQAEEDNRDLVGTCYVCTESINTPTTEIGDYRKVYFRVDKVQGNRVTYFTFWCDERGKVVFEPNFVSSNMFARTYPRITARQFNRALGKARARALKMTYNAVVGVKP